MGRETRSIPMDDNEAEQKREAAAEVLNNYSLFLLVCIEEEVQPCDLWLHLMKVISGMPSTLRKNPLPPAASPDSTGEPSSSGTMKVDKSGSS